MEKELHTGTHRASPEEILKEKILSARKKPIPSEEKEDEFHSVPSPNKTWFERNEYVVIGLIVLTLVVAGCIVLNALGV